MAEHLSPTYVAQRLHQHDLFYLTPSLLADLLSLEQRQTYRLVARLKDEGLVDEVEKGKYLLLELERERELDTVEAAHLIQKGEIEARHVLESLVEAGLLEGRGRTRGRTCHLSAAVYRRTGRPVAYIHRRGFEPLQMEQMILRYVQAHGQIARRDVVELCRVNENQAAYLLKKLVRQGRLHLVGHGRSSHYEIVGDSR
jgi:predicted transcriptional regulator of viral defense system